MPVARLSFPSYQSSNENGGGNHAWQNVQGAGSSAYGAGAFDSRDPNSANMNWIRSYGDGARGSASIPAGSAITGIVVGFQGYQTGGSQTGGTYDVSIFKGGSAVASKTGSLSQGATVGPFGAPNDLWGLGGLATPSYFTNMYFGLHLNFPNIISDISVFAWNGYMDIYYNDPVPVPAAITAGAGNNQSAQISTQYGQQLYAIVSDQGGNPIAGKSVTFTMPSSGPSATFNSVGGPLTATGTTNASGGAVSPFFYANATPGAFQPVADVTGTSPLIFVRFNMTNTSPPPVLVPTTITKIQGDGQQTPVSYPFNVVQMVQVKDQFGAVMNNVEITWSVPASGARGTYAGGTPAFSFTNTSGIAQAPVLTANGTVGSWVENAFPTGTAVVAGFNFTNLANNLPPTPTSLQPVQGADQAAALNALFPTAVQVRVLDQYGSPMSGVSVGGTIPNANNGKFSNNTQALTVVSGAGGIANFGQPTAGPVASAGWNITMNCAGTPGLVFGPLRNVDTTLVSTITAVNGMAQTAVPSGSFAQALQARATNGLGAPMQNVSITFTAPGSAASCRFSGSATQVVLTDVNGYAQTVIPVATATEGQYTVVASASGATSANFPLTNGIVYDAEICTAFIVPPTGSVNTGTGGVTSNEAWTTPQNSSAAAAGAAYAEMAKAGGTSNKSQFMSATAVPAWAAIPNGAKVNSVSFQFSQNRQTNSTQVLEVYLINAAGAILATTPVNFNNSSGTVGVWVALGPTTLATTAPQLFGSDINSGLAGIAMRYQGAFGATTNRINGLQVKICYQLVSPPPLRPQLPLMYCEA